MENLESRLRREMEERLQYLEEMCDDDSDQMVAMYRRNISGLINEIIAETLKAAVSAIEGEKTKTLSSPEEETAEEYEIRLKATSKAFSTAITAVEGVGKTG